MSKNKDLSTAYGMQKRKKMKGPPSAKSESRPSPDQESEGEARNSGDKALHQDRATDMPERRQSMKGPRTTPIKHPSMSQSPVFKTKLRDQEDHLEASERPASPRAQPPKADDEMGATRTGPKVPDMQKEHSDKRAPYAEGGEVDSDELDMDHHESMVAAIMARRDRLHAEIESGAHDLDSAVKMAEGGMADLDMNAEEEPNDFDDMNEAALKENYDEDMDSIHEPEDSNEMGDERESDEEDEHDMISSIRRKVSKRQR